MAEQSLLFWKSKYGHSVNIINARCRELRRCIFPRCVINKQGFTTKVQNKRAQQRIPLKVQFLQKSPNIKSQSLDFYHDVPFRSVFYCGFSGGFEIMFFSSWVIKLTQSVFSKGINKLLYQIVRYNDIIKLKKTLNHLFR